MNISFRCLESRIDTNDTLYGKFSISCVPSGQGNTFANALRRSLFSDLSGLAITHFCITSNPKLDYEFATLPGLTESLLDFSLNLKKIVLTGRLTKTPSFKLKQKPKRYYENEEAFLTKPSAKVFAMEKNSIPAFHKVSSQELGLCASKYIFDGSNTLVNSKTKFSISAKMRGAFNMSFTYPGGAKQDKKKISQNKKLTEQFFTDFKQEIEDLIKVLPNVKNVKQEIKDLEAKNLETKDLERLSLSNLSLAPIGFLKVKGPAVLRACDLVLPPGVRCVNPNQYLGTLAADGALSIKFLIAAGKGYCTQDETFYDSLSQTNLLPKLSCTSGISQNSKFLMSTPDKNTPAKYSISNTHSMFTPLALGVVGKGKGRSTNYPKKTRIPNVGVNFLSRKVDYKSAWPTILRTSSKMSKIKSLTSKQEKIYCNLEKKSFVIKKNLSKKLTKKQFIWNGEQNFYPVLPLDATFTPISKVNFQIDVNRDREKNQENIIFEIWTNGSITPKRAIQESSLILAQDFYNLFCSLNESSNFELWWKRESSAQKNTFITSFNKIP